MNKFLSICLTSVLILTLCACGNNDVTKNDPTPSRNTGRDNSFTPSTPSISSNNPSSSQINSSKPTQSSDADSSKVQSSNTESSEPEVPKFLPTGETFTLNGKTYTLSLFDDFEGTTLNSKVWARCPEWTRGDIGGKWDDDMVWLDGEGFLHVGVSRASNGALLSGGIRTRSRWERNLFAQARGYFEINCKLPKATGCWSAFWLMSDVSKIGNGAVDGAEIDIMESFDVKNGLINHAIHCDGYGIDHKSIGCETRKANLYDGKFHTFALLWNENGYYFYVDGIQTNKLDNTQSNFLGSCTSEAYLKITTEFGTWGGEVNDSLLPDALVVDYVRVYKED